MLMDVGVTGPRRSARRLSVQPGVKKYRLKPPLPSSPVSSRKLNRREDGINEQEESGDDVSGGEDIDNLEEGLDAVIDNTASVRKERDRGRFTARRRKGLRHYAVKVCKLVRAKGITTYQDVANEVVVEEKRAIAKELVCDDIVDREDGSVRANHKYVHKEKMDESWVDEKNIRRRVYDSLNVLMAMGVIRRHRKMVTWVGLAEAEYGSRESELSRLSRVREEKQQAVFAKQKLIAEMCGYEERLGDLVNRNASPTSVRRIEVPSQQKVKNIGSISVPFNMLIIPAATKVNLAMNDERNEVCISVSDSFSLWDDKEILKCLNT